MQVRNGMTKVVLTVGPGHTLREAARLMADRRVGAAVVLDVHTGEVLALANWPTYNPNDRTKLTGEQLRNRVITDTFNAEFGRNTGAIIDVVRLAASAPTLDRVDGRSSVLRAAVRRDRAGDPGRRPQHPDPDC